MVKRNFALVGEIGSGKDTVASMIPGYIRKAFGDPIRLVARNLRVNGVEAAYCQLCEMFKRNPPKDLRRILEEFKNIPQVDQKDRLLLQTLGTYCRENDDLIWVRQVTNGLSKDNNYVVTDVRRPTEFIEMCKKDFVMVYILSDIDLCVERVEKRDGSVNIEAFYHKAEADIKNLRTLCDITIDNTGSLQKLASQVSDLLFIYNL
jgi:dephospho-CoA kinase